MRKILCLVLVFVMLFAFCGCDDITYDSQSIQEDIQSQQDVNTETKKEETATLGQKNALRKADSYLDLMAFSKSGLVNQLEFEGFSTEDAAYAAENCGADWNKQAAKKAESYLDLMSFSKEGLIKQLEFEGFTHEQAVYGAEAVGY